MVRSAACRRSLPPPSTMSRSGKSSDVNGLFSRPPQIWPATVAAAVIGWRLPFAIRVDMRKDLAASS